MGEEAGKLGVADERRRMDVKGKKGGKAVSLDARRLGFLVDWQLKAVVLG
jgi:hypothetical protein